MAPDERRHFLANADADATRLTMLTARLLELARADLFANDPAERADLASVLRRRADACADGFAVSLDLSPLALPEAAVDAIAGALIDTARQAGAHAIAFAACALPASGIVRTTATDDGPGIAPGDRARVFEPFLSTRRTSGGSGLGLPIILSLVAVAGGSLRLADSAEHDAGGACFVLELPVAPSGVFVRLTQSPPSVQDARSRPHGKRARNAGKLFPPPLRGRAVCLIPLR
jgi:signal transduction histidine kinase